MLINNLIKFYKNNASTFPQPLTYFQNDISVILIDELGNLVSPNLIKVDGEHINMYPTKRTNNILPRLLIDGSKYVITEGKALDAFFEQIKRLYMFSGENPLIKPIVLFYEKQEYKKLVIDNNKDKLTFVTFMLEKDDKLIIEKEGIIDILIGYAHHFNYYDENREQKLLSMVSGEPCYPLRNFLSSLQGYQVDSGFDYYSNNVQGLNCPTSLIENWMYDIAYNYLNTARNDNGLQKYCYNINDIKILLFSPNSKINEEISLDLFFNTDKTDASFIIDALKKIPQEWDDEDVYLYVLRAPNQRLISILYESMTKLKVIRQNIINHYSFNKLHGGNLSFINMANIVNKSGKIADIRPDIIKQLFDCMLLGQHYNVNFIHEASRQLSCVSNYKNKIQINTNIINAYLNRNMKINDEMCQTNTSYLFGKWYGILVKAEKDAKNVDSYIKTNFMNGYYRLITKQPQQQHINILKVFSYVNTGNKRRMFYILEEQAMREVQAQGGVPKKLDILLFQKGLFEELYLYKSQDKESTNPSLEEVVYENPD